MPPTSPPILASPARALAPKPHEIGSLPSPPHFPPLFPNFLRQFEPPLHPLFHPTLPAVAALNLPCPGLLVASLRYKKHPRGSLSRFSLLPELPAPPPALPTPSRAPPLAVELQPIATAAPVAAAPRKHRHRHHHALPHPVLRSVSPFHRYSHLPIANPNHHRRSPSPAACRRRLSHSRALPPPQPASPPSGQARSPHRSPIPPSSCPLHGEPEPPSPLPPPAANRRRSRLSPASSSPPSASQGRREPGPPLPITGTLPKLVFTGQ